MKIKKVLVDYFQQRAIFQQQLSTLPSMSATLDCMEPKKTFTFCEISLTSEYLTTQVWGTASEAQVSESVLGLFHETQTFLDVHSCHFFTVM